MQKSMQRSVFKLQLIQEIVLKGYTFNVIIYTHIQILTYTYTYMYEWIKEKDIDTHSQGYKSQ